jgi:hypothetical protein
MPAALSRRDRKTYGESESDGSTALPSFTDLSPAALTLRPAVPPPQMATFHHKHTGCPIAELVPAHLAFPLVSFVVMKNSGKYKNIADFNICA